MLEKTRKMTSPGRALISIAPFVEVPEESGSACIVTESSGTCVLFIHCEDVRRDG